MRMPHDATTPLPSHPPRGALARRRMLAAGAGLLALAALPHAQAVEFEGQTFPDHLTLADTPLQLNGVGLRAAYFIKGYTAALYLSGRARSLAEAMALPGPKRLQMRLLLSVGPEEFSKALVAGVRKNASEEELRTLDARIHALDAVIRTLPKSHKGDVVDLDFDPPRGMTLALNGRVRGAPIEGADFYAAVLGIFIGERPIDQRLKKGLLGL